MNKKANVEIPFFVYDKYSGEACFILLKNNPKTEAEGIKITATTRISS